VIPTDDTIIVVESELEGVMAWSTRQAVPVEWLPEALELRATFTQPGTNDRFFVRGRFQDYKELPPLFTFTGEDWVTEGNIYFPKPMLAPTPWGGASMFIQHAGRAVICAPFNRLAFAQLQGPHPDWGHPEQWQTAAPQHVHAVEIADMLQVVARDITHTHGRM
jgi:hypothetical protein